MRENFIFLLAWLCFPGRLIFLKARIVLNGTELAYFRLSLPLRYVGMCTYQW